VPKADKGVVRREIVSPDEHCPFHDPAAVACLERAIEIVKPDAYNCLGDFGEFESASHWQWRKKRRPPLEYQLEAIDRDIEAVNQHLNKRDRVCAKAGVKVKRMIQGNHDDWLDRVVEENPYLARTLHKWGVGYKFKDALNLKHRGWTFHPFGEYVKIGHIRLYHGHHYKGIHHTRTHLLNLGCNLMYAHHHDIQHREVTHIDGPKAAWAIGCLKDPRHEASNEWLGRRKTNWGHAFAIIDFSAGGRFYVHVVRIIDGRCSLWEELIDGNKK
jgi:hypothetical protein